MPRSPGGWWNSRHDLGPEITAQAPVRLFDGYFLSKAKFDRIEGAQLALVNRQARHLSASQVSKAVSFSQMRALLHHLSQLLVDVTAPAEVPIYGVGGLPSHGNGFFDRLGLPYEKLAEINPRLVVCSISGFGDYGPNSGLGGGDFIVQAMSGAMAITGGPGGGPQLSSVPWTDCAAGTTACTAICAALYHRERTGKGQYIDISMQDSVMHWHDFAIEEYVFSEGKVERKHNGPYHPTLAPYGVWECQDGHVLFIVVHDQGWTQLCEVMGRPELATDPRYDSLPGRVEHREEVTQIVADWVKHFTVEEAKMLLLQAGIGCPTILGIGELVNDPHVRAREMLVEMDHPQAGRHRVPNSAFKFSLTPARVPGRAPLLGEHNREVLADVLGYDEERIERLTTDGVIYEEAAVAGLR